MRETSRALRMISSFQRYGLNDANELARQVALSDARELVVRAEPAIDATTSRTR
jgi:hypothetical protein